MTILGKNKIIFIVIIIVLLLFYFVFLYSVFLKPADETYVFKQKPVPTPSSIEAQYSNFNLLVPGKSTIEDVDRIAGAPVSIKKDGQNIFLYFNTPVAGAKNIILLKNGVVFYALENVFGNYRGSYDSYVKAFGKADLTLNEDLYSWSVFLKRGVMIESGSNVITKIIYFVPQDQDSFFSFVAKDFGLSKENLKETGNAIPGP